MGSFDEAVTFVLANEGGYVNNSHDAGGSTNFGISLRLLRTLSGETLRKCGIFCLPGDLDAEHIKDLTVDQAKLVYKFVFWEAAPFDRIINQEECNYIFDMSVQFGVCQAIKLAQRAIWDYNQKREYGSIQDDGILGENTLYEINGCSSLIQALIGERVGFVRMLCEIKPSHKEFLNGWLDRCYRF